jgi:DNA repair exonuclease SbcCD ATPase subunit
VNKIKVIWQGNQQDFRHSNEREIFDYFSNKYNTTSVTISKEDESLKQIKSNIDVSDINADASDLVLNDEFQRRLIEQYIKDNKLDVNVEHIFRLDNKINGLIVDYKERTIRHKNIKPLDIEFSNFLSYGENNKIDFTKHIGITTIIGTPENFSGKTTLAVDLLLFLFFGDTTKTSVNAEIFNSFSNKDSLYVRGRIKVDDEIIVIKRTLIRNKKKDGSYNVTGNLELFKEDINGNLIVDNKENSGGTDKYIKEVVGTYDDFLITILTTGRNLTSLIDTKPTERGKLLTRFIGLEIFNEKLLKAKDDYKMWYSGSKLSQYTTVDLKNQNDKLTIEIDETKLKKVDVENNIEISEKNIKDYESQYEDLINKKKPIDNSLYLLTPQYIIDNISKLKSSILIYEDKNKNLSDILKIKPVEEKIFADELLREYESSLSLQEVEIKKLNSSRNTYLVNIRINESNLQKLDTAKTCPHCNKALDYDNIEEERTTITNLINSDKDLLNKIDENIKTIESGLLIIKKSISDRKQYVNEINSKWDDYYKTELLLERNNLEITSLNEKLNKDEATLKRLDELKDDIEFNKNLEQEINIVKYKKKTCEDEKKVLTLQLLNFESLINNNENKIDGNKKILEQLKKDEVANKVYLAYLDIFGKNGISKMVLSTMMPIMNQHLQMLMFDTCEFTLDIRLNHKEEVEFIMIDNYSGIEKSLKSGSGYEMTIALLALRCVLSKVCSLPKLSINVFDEITGGVAQSNMDNIRMFFERIKTFFEHIIIISHDETVQSWGENKIYVEKINNISYVKKPD